MVTDSSRTVIEVWTPAKLNLFLEVRARRPDGYHDLETVMTAINLYDTLQFSSSNGTNIQLDVHWTWGQSSRVGRNGQESLTLENLRGDVPADANNLVVRALELLRRSVGDERGAAVRLMKRIPSAAGLGGASSDAAAALVAGNIGWGLRRSREQLQELAEELGSDVPFFLQARTAMCRGRGERITPLPWQSPWHVVIVRPPVGLATGEVFRRCQVPAGAQCRSWPNAGLGRARPAQSRDWMFNRLQFAAETLTPWIDHIRREFRRQQVLGHQLSGSGSCYFAVCHSHVHAAHVARRMAADGRWKVFQGVTDCAMHTRVRRHCRN